MQLSANVVVVVTRIAVIDLIAGRPRYIQMDMRLEVVKSTRRQEKSDRKRNDPGWDVT